MILERRIAHLESNLKGRDTMPQPQLSVDDIIRRFRLEPDTIKATASANGQGVMEVIAGELGMSYGDLKKIIEAGARGALQ